MLPIQIYAIVMASTVIILVAFRLAASAWYRLKKLVGVRALRKLVFQPLVDRHTWFGPWRRLSFASQILWLCSTLFVIFYNGAELQSVGQQAGNVTVLNMTPFYLASHLSFASDWLGISLSTIKAIHKGASVMLVVTTIIHVICMKTHAPVFTLTELRQLYGVIASLAIALLFVLCLKPLQRGFYEFFLRAHQVLAVCIWFAVWQHVMEGTVVARYGAIGLAGAFGMSSIAQLLDVLFRNNLFINGLPRAHFQRIDDAVRITVINCVFMRIHPGQFVNLYVPGLGVKSCLQSHPFIVISAQRVGNGTRFELMVEPRMGWTRRLLLHAKTEQYTSATRREQLHLAFFSGPHGRSISMNNYGVVFLAATGWGLMALIPRLQHLLHGFNNGTSKVRRLHLVWQLGDISHGAPARELLNRALTDDTLDHGHILKISIYHSRDHIDPKERKPGQRLTFFEGVADWETMIIAELTDKWEHSSRSFEIGEDARTDVKQSAFHSEPCQMLVASRCLQTGRHEIGSETLFEDLSSKLESEPRKGIPRLVGSRNITTTEDLRSGLVITKKRDLGPEDPQRSTNSPASSFTSQSTHAMAKLDMSGSKRGSDSTGEPLSKRRRSSQVSNLRKEVKPNSIGSKTPKQSFNAAESSSPERSSYRNRVLTYLTISPAGRPLQHFDSVLEVLHAFRDAIKSHRSLFLERDILHRDISMNNIILTDPAKNNGCTGILIDLDLAVLVGKDGKNEPSEEKTMTGTFEYMAVLCGRNKLQLKNMVGLRSEHFADMSSVNFSAW